MPDPPNDRLDTSQTRDKPAYQIRVIHPRLHDIRVHCFDQAKEPEQAIERNPASRHVQRTNHSSRLLKASGIHTTVHQRNDVVVVSLGLVNSYQSEKYILRTSTGEPRNDVKDFHWHKNNGPTCISATYPLFNNPSLHGEVIDLTKASRTTKSIAHPATLETSARSTTGSASFDVR